MLPKLQPHRPRYSLDTTLLQDIFRYARPLGHHEDKGSLNLGFGFIYYGLVRALRPNHILVIGSGFGFSVVCLALGLKDNASGRLSFVDPSYSVLKNGPLQTIGGTSQWSNPAKVQAHFDRFGVGDIVTHYKLTSEAFFQQYGGLGLGPIDVGFIDGNHSFASARHDFVGALQHSRKNTYLLLHDTNLYVREFLRHAGVKRLTRAIGGRTDDFEVIDFPFASGVALVRVMHDGTWTPDAL
jgi:Methyltransferase domain